MEEKKKRIAILGSTGSIGTQALAVISEHHKLFEVEVLTANSNSDLLIEQAKKFKPNTVVIADECKYQEVNQALFDLGIKVFAGEQSLAEVVEGENIDLVLTALVGYAGLKPTVRAIKAKKNIALACVFSEDLVSKQAIVCTRFVTGSAPTASGGETMFFVKEL